ncbi:hypothetical protein BHE74_00046579 [Ensete ventricosum]|nr:hypothetical protein BHE74_00046579 [Ensete ventricosum]
MNHSERGEVVGVAEEAEERDRGGDGEDNRAMHSRRGSRESGDLGRPPEAPAGALPAATHAERVWEKHIEFKPERLMAGGEGEATGATESKEIKMMPFGTRRRICPRMGPAKLHLEYYFMANLVWEFQRKPATEEEEEEEDRSEKLVFSVVMKRPLSAPLSHNLGHHRGFHHGVSNYTTIIVEIFIRQ